MHSKFLWLYEKKKKRIINMSRLYKKPTTTKKNIYFVLVEYSYAISFFTIYCIVRS